MAEQNAHDDERDTADLAAGDATASAVGDTLDSAVDDASDLATGDATDLETDDTADLAATDAGRSHAPAEQPTPAGRAVSPSPSPTPTFAATDRPARRARRLRWKPGITRPMMALSAVSFALMVAGVGGYVSAIPAVIAGNKPSAVVIPLESALWLDGQMREVQAGPVDSARAVGPVTIEASKTDAVAPDAAAALGLGSGSGSGMLGVASLTGASAASSVDSSFTRAQQIAGGASAASGSGSASGFAASGGSSQAGSGSAGSGSSSGSGSGSGNSGGSGSASGDASGSGSGSESAGGSDSGSAPAPAGPTAEQEAAAYAVLVDHQARVNDYVARVQQRLHEYVALASPKRLQRVRRHRQPNAH